MKQVKILIVALFITQISFSQKKDENIGTEVVNVVKPYTPTISDAFKVKETPTLDDEDTSKKEAIQYNIFSFPVASTFTPSKGRAASVDKSADEKIFSNYLTLGAGNYGTANVELLLQKILATPIILVACCVTVHLKAELTTWFWMISFSTLLWILLMVAEPERCLGMLIWAIKIKFIIGMEFIPELLIMLRLIQ